MFPPSESEDDLDEVSDQVAALRIEENTQDPFGGIAENVTTVLSTPKRAPVVEASFSPISGKI